MPKQKESINASWNQNGVKIDHKQKKITKLTMAQPWEESLFFSL
jgi:hypothetical protein